MILESLTDAVMNAREDGDLVALRDFDREEADGLDASDLAFRQVRFRRCRFTDCRLDSAAFYDCVFTDCVFVSCRLAGSFWRECSLAGCKVEGGLSEKPL